MQLLNTWSMSCVKEEKKNMFTRHVQTKLMQISLQINQSSDCYCVYKKRFELFKCWIFQLMSYNKIEPVHEISNNLVCATSKAPDQPAQTRSLIRAFASRLSILWLMLATDWAPSKVKRRLQRLVWVYTCQNVKFLEITCGALNHPSINK